MTPVDPWAVLEAVILLFVGFMIAKNWGRRRSHQEKMPHPDGGADNTFDGDGGGDGGNGDG